MDGEKLSTKLPRKQTTDRQLQEVKPEVYGETDRQKVNKLLPILFLPANHNRKERDSYWGDGENTIQKVCLCIVIIIVINNNNK